MYEIHENVPYNITIPLHIYMNTPDVIQEIHFNHLNKSLKTLKYEKNKLVLFSVAISVFFKLPEPHKYFMSSIIRDDRFNFENLINEIYNVGLKAIAWHIEHHPTYYNQMSEKELIKKYSLRTDNIRVTGNCVYVNLKILGKSY